MILNIEQNTTPAIFLMLYEMIAVYFIIALLCCFSKARTRAKAKNTTHIQYVCNVKTVQKKNIILPKKAKITIGVSFVLVNLILLFIAITAFIAVPAFSQMYRPIWDIQRVLRPYHYTQGLNSRQQVIVVAGFYSMNIIRLTIPAIFCLIYKKYIKNSLLAVVASILSISLILLFVDATVARVLIYALVLFIFIAYLYPTIKTKLYIFAGSVAFLLIGTFFVVRFFVSPIDNLFDYFSATTNAYFSGVNTVSAVFNMPTRSSNQTINFIAIDVFQSFPRMLFPFAAERQSFASVYNDYNQHGVWFGQQIPPTIGIGFHYFGAIFAPIISMACTFVAVRFGERVERIRNPIYKLATFYAIVIFCLAIAIYNISIILPFVVAVLLPIMIMSKLCYGKKRRSVCVSHNSLQPPQFSPLEKISLESMAKETLSK